MSSLSLVSKSGGSEAYGRWAGAKLKSKRSATLATSLLGVLIFVIAALMSFSMGTSWGTFGMLIPIVTMICEADGMGALLIPALGTPIVALLLEAVLLVGTILLLNKERV